MNIALLACLIAIAIAGPILALRGIGEYPRARRDRTRESDGAR